MHDVKVVSCSSVCNLDDKLEHIGHLDADRHVTGGCRGLCDCWHRVTHPLPRGGTDFMGRRQE
jgi:hypothetical protein